MKRVISCVLLMLVLTSNAFALEVPTDTVVQNLNGSQQAIKTFTVSPEQDPAALIEEPFELEGYLYTFADIVKSENPVEEKRIHTEVITVETTKDDLALILEQLKPTIEYDDGRFQGTLALDHTSLNTVAAGYATKNYTVTETKTIGQLDRNDMSYVPATTIKNGRTLSLANVEWQVTGTDLVGEALMPSQYQAVATYSAKASYQAATGYVNRAQASRRQASRSQRRFFAAREDLHAVGSRITCRMLAVGPRRCLVDCYGYDLDMTQKEIRYAAIPDLRTEFHPGSEIDCIVKEYHPRTGELIVSAKETEVNPFFGAEERHPVGSRRFAMISGKYGGGVFCNLPDGVTCMCNYSYQHEDADFMVGEHVMLMVQRYDQEKLQMYGKIMSKW